MKKFSVIILIFIFIFIFSLPVCAKPKKYVCKKPVYFFEDVIKADFVNELDKIIEANEFNVEKYYPYLGFISIKYKVQKEPEIVSFDVKQYGNDVYLFIDISKPATNLEDKIYKPLQKKYPKSYLINSNYLCREFEQDINSIVTKKKTTMRESEYNHEVYVMDMKRYVGYPKVVYRWKIFKEKCLKVISKTKEKIKL